MNDTFAVSVQRRLTRVFFKILLLLFTRILITNQYLYWGVALFKARLPPLLHV